MPLYSVGASEKNGLSNSKLNKLLIFSGRQEHSVLIRSLEDSLLSEAQESRQIRWSEQFIFDPFGVQWRISLGVNEQAPRIKYTQNTIFFVALGLWLVLWVVAVITTYVGGREGVGVEFDALDLPQVLNPPLLITVQYVKYWKTIRSKGKNRLITLASLAHIRINDTTGYK